MLSLEEAIQHCEEKADELENYAYLGYDDDHKCDLSDEERTECKECASEHRQLAEWLKKLKAYEEGCKCETCKYKDADSVSRPCMDCGDNESKWEYGGAE